MTSRAAVGADSPLAAFLRGVAEQTKLVPPPPTGALAHETASRRKAQ